ncbi:MAG: Flagellar hook-basal body complex protein FliE [Ilumatobacteraceae bacterium]|jgi:flagellar hook-basal body complex protein FliE|nr:Flagellar hook-basal body complex protein FliE [Ilumatobacteraceae bacterium]
MSAIGPIGSPIGGVGGIGGSSSVAGAKPASGFGDAMLKGLDSVAGLEKNADNLVANMASGGNVQIADVMAATSKANLGMSIVNEIRSRGLEAYQSIINVQV